MFWIVHPSVAANSVTELVDLIKRNPDKLTFSSGGFGTPAHLIGELFKLRTGVHATHVPYQQFPQAIGDRRTDIASSTQDARW